jgi:peroxiredoxin
LVECDRCHRNFSSYTALSQHYETKHHNARTTREIAKGLAAEKELERYEATVHHARSPSKAKFAVLFLILIIAAGVIGYVAFTPTDRGATIVGVSSVAPDFTLQATNGRAFTLFAYRGKSNVLLLFNEGLSCQPCLQQMHDLDGLHAQFNGMGVLVVSITPDSIDQLRSWARSYGSQDGLVLSDPNQIAFSLYHPVGTGGSMMTHTFILVNESGVIVWRQDYGPSNMYVQNSEILAAVRNALVA